MTTAMTREDVTKAIRTAKAAADVSWQEIAKAIGKSPVWTTSACLGQNSMPPKEAETLASFLGLPEGSALALQECPSKGKVLDIPKDPLLYRFHEINLVYGETIKELIHEQFGDGIMSAIDSPWTLTSWKTPKVIASRSPCAESFSRINGGKQGYLRLTIKASKTDLFQLKIFFHSVRRTFSAQPCV